jgi:hypothetical protein
MHKPAGAFKNYREYLNNKINPEFIEEEEIELSEIEKVKGIWDGDEGDDEEVHWNGSKHY